MEAVLLFDAPSQASAVFIQLSCHEAEPEQRRSGRGLVTWELDDLQLIISSSALSGMSYDSAVG